MTYQSVSPQAARIIAKFGNARRLSRVLGDIAEIEGNQAIYRSPATVYKWTYPRSRGGTGGLIPTSAVPHVRHAARIDGIYLTTEDWAL